MSNIIYASNGFDSNLAIPDPNNLYIRSNSTKQNNSTMDQNKHTKYDGSFFKTPQRNTNSFQPLKAHAFAHSDKMVSVGENGELPVIIDKTPKLRKSVFETSQFNMTVNPEISAVNNSRSPQKYLDPKLHNPKNYLNTVDRSNLSRHEENDSEYCLLKEFGINIQLLREINNFFLNFPNRSYADANQYYKGKSKDEFSTFYNELKQQKSSFEKYIEHINVFQDTRRKYIDKTNDLRPAYGESQSKSTNAVKNLSLTDYSISQRNMKKPIKSFFTSNTSTNKLLENSCANFSKMVKNYKSETRLNDLRNQSRSSMNIQTNMQILDSITNLKKKSVANPRDERSSQLIRRSSHITPQNQNGLETNFELKIQRESSRDILQKASMGAFSNQKSSEASDEEIIDKKDKLAKKSLRQSLYKLPNTYQKEPLHELDKKTFKEPLLKQGLQIFANGLKKMIERTYQTDVITNEIMNKVFIKPIESFGEFMEDKNMVLQQKQVFTYILGTETEGIDDEGQLNNLSPIKHKLNPTQKKNYRVKHTKSNCWKPNTNKGPPK